MDGLRVTARSLLIDVVVGEVGVALRAAGVRALLLKGAAIAAWLYDDGVPRSYGDADVLVAPADFAPAEDVLGQLGFTLVRPELSPLEETSHGRVWARNQWEVVDLHRSLWGVGVVPGRAWSVLTRNTETATVGGAPIEVLAVPARVLHLTLHAAQHGAIEAKPREDLVRASGRVPLDTWHRAAALARELRCESAMGAGLRLEPATRALATQLGLPRRVPVAVALHATNAPLCAAGLMKAMDAPGIRAKGAMAARRLIPTAARIKARYPFASRGRAALAFAYLCRAMALARQAPAALHAIGRAVRARWRL